MLQYLRMEQSNDMQFHLSTVYHRTHRWQIMLANRNFTHLGQIICSHPSCIHPTADYFPSTQMLSGPCNVVDIIHYFTSCESTSYFAKWQTTDEGGSRAGGGKLVMLAAPTAVKPWWWLATSNNTALVVRKCVEILWSCHILLDMILDIVVCELWSIDLI